MPASGEQGAQLDQVSGDLDAFYTRIFIRAQEPVTRRQHDQIPVFEKEIRQSFRSGAAGNRFRVSLGLRSSRSLLQHSVCPEPPRFRVISGLLGLRISRSLPAYSTHPAPPNDD